MSDYLLNLENINYSFDKYVVTEGFEAKCQYFEKLNKS